MKKNNMTWVVVAIIAVALIYGSSQGWFKSSSSYSTVNNYQQTTETATTNYILSISLVPTQICKGQSVTGTITSNMPNAVCNVQYRLSSLMSWQSLPQITLDNYGSYSQTVPINAAGTALLRAVCLKDGSYRVSNEQTLNVNDCTNPQPQYTCIDSDNGIDFSVIGHCQDSFHQLGFSDGCQGSETYPREYYCDDNGICQWVPNTNQRCVNGQNAIACSAIVLPSSQASCDVGICETGSCTFVPATLSTAARCTC